MTRAAIEFLALAAMAILVVFACWLAMYPAARAANERANPCATIRTCTPDPSGECAPIRRGPAVCGCVVVQGWWEDRVVCWEVAP